MCYNFTAANMSAILRHFIGTVHSHQAGFRVVCGIRDCPRTYDNYHSFRKHLCRKHMETLALGVPETYYGRHTGDDSNGDFHGDLSEHCGPIWDRRNAALFILKNKEVLNDLLGDVSMVMRQTIDHLSSRVLERNGIEYQDSDGLTEVLSSCLIHSVVWSLIICRERLFVL